MYAALFDFRAPCPQTKILIFQGTLKLKRQLQNIIDFWAVFF